MKTVLLWLGFALCVIFGVLLCGLSVTMLLQPTAALIVLVPVALYLLYSFEAGIFRFFGRVLRREIGAEDCLVLETASTLGFLFGIFGMVIGFVMVMSRLSDPAKLGAGVAVSVISLLYGAIPAIMLLPLRPPVRKSSVGDTTTGKSAGFMIVAFFMMTTSFSAVLYALRK